MKLNELKELIDELVCDGHGEKDVRYKYELGDYWKRTAALSVESCQPAIVEENPSFDGYADEPIELKLTEDGHLDDEDKFYDEDNANCIVIS